MPEYCKILKSLKAGSTVYMEGTVLFPPFPDDIKTEIDSGSSKVEYVMMEEIDLFDKQPPVEVKKPVKKRAKK